MTTGESHSNRVRPVCGVLSLALPLGVAALGFIASSTIQEGDSGSLGIYILAFYAVIASMIVAIVLAIAGLVRRERWAALPWLALGLNAIGLGVLCRMVFF